MELLKLLKLRSFTLRLTPLMAISTVGVIGCGLMGSGIAQACAQKGYRTIVREVSDEFLAKGLGRIRKFLEDGVKRGKVAQADAEQALSRLSGTTDFGALKECDLVIEAVVERMDVKKSVLRETESKLKDGVLTSNTSTLSSTRSSSHRSQTYLAPHGGIGTSSPRRRH